MYQEVHQIRSLYCSTLPAAGTGKWEGVCDWSVDRIRQKRVRVQSRVVAGTAASKCFPLIEGRPRERPLQCPHSAQCSEFGKENYQG